MVLIDDVELGVLLLALLERLRLRIARREGDGPAVGRPRERAWTTPRPTSASAPRRRRDRSGRSAACPRGPRRTPASCRPATRPARCSTCGRWSAAASLPTARRRARSRSRRRCRPSWFRARCRRPTSPSGEMTGEPTRASEMSASMVGASRPRPALRAGVCPLADRRATAQRREGCCKAHGSLPVVWTQLTAAAA